MPIWQPERLWSLVIRHAKESLPGSKNEVHAAYMSVLQALQLLT